MPGYKKKYTKRSGGTRRYKRADHYAASKIQAVVKRALDKNIETKTGLRSTTVGLQIAHNNFQTISNSLLYTQNGTLDAEAANGNRIGDKICLKGVCIRGMVQVNERYSDITFRVFVVKSAKGDTPTNTTFWQGLSGNRMIDMVNTERFTVLYQKTYKIKAGNMGNNSGEAVGTGAGTEYVQTGTGSWNTLSRATRIFNVWLPGKKFGNNGYITYENGGTQPKFFDYHCIVYAYSNYDTDAALGYNVARLDDCFTKLYYKDA